VKFIISVYEMVFIMFGLLSFSLAFTLWRDRSCSDAAAVAKLLKVNGHHYVCVVDEAKP
jgi:hypothetical protein